MFESIVEDVFGLVGADGEPVPLVGVDVKAVLVGRGARVTLAQRFINTEKQPIEAVYKFPLPEGGAVCGFRVRIGDRAIESEISERGEAFRRYDEALAAGHGAYLLDEERPNVYTLSVGNLEPGMEAVAEVTYVGLLELIGSRVRFFLPTTISPRYVPAGVGEAERRHAGEAVNPDVALDVPYGLRVAVDIHARESIEAVASPSHPVAVDFGAATVHVELTAESTRMDRDFVLDVTHRQGSGHRGYLSVGEGEAFAQVDLAFPEPQEEAAATTEREVVFVVDCSGSMGGSSIEQARQAVAILLRSLPEGVRFNVIRFGSRFQPLFASAEPYAAATAAKALALVEAMDADLGGTEILRPLEAATERPPVAAARRDVILITDGQVGNEDEVVRLVEGRRERNRVFTVGIGHGPNEYFVRQVARTSGGICVMVGPKERIEPPVLRLFRRVISAPVTGLRIDWPGTAEQAPFAPVVHLGETASVFARVPGAVASGGAGLSAAVSARVADVDVTLQVSLEPVAIDATPLPQLWAREAVRDMEEGADERSRRGSKQDRGSGDVATRVVEVSRRYGVLSRSTSFLAIETREGEDRTREESVLRRVPVMLTKDWHGIGVRSRGTRGIGFGGPAVAAASAPPAMLRRSMMPLPSMARMSIDAAMPVFADRAESPADDSPEGKVLATLALQRPEGGFALSPELAKLAGVPLEVLQDAAAKVGAAGAADPGAVVATAVALAVLRTRFAAHAALWGSLVRKSESWLAARTAAPAVTVDGVPLEDWAAGLANA